MKTIVNRIKTCIEQKLDAGFREFIIYPFGDVGMRVKQILNNVYGIQEAYILDNHLSKYNPGIKEVEFCKELNCEKYCLILASTNQDIYQELKSCVSKYFHGENIAELECFKKKIGGGVFETKIGKYSYGSICKNSPYVESVGAFCSFAAGCHVQGNHQMKCITTHQMIDAGVETEEVVEYTTFEGKDWYFPGVKPRKEYVEKQKRIRIGNDVWFGQNVIVTNYANIGNGVIAGAGSIITKDVPDYAVVVGAPARIIKYRYLPEEISALNQIAWWDWTDDEIRERFDDLYLPIGQFISKYLNK